jgi:hypothetical protein
MFQLTQLAVQWSHFFILHYITRLLGIVAHQIPLPECALAFLNRALDAIQAAQADEHPVPTPTRQVLGDAAQDLSEDDDVVWLQTLPAAAQVDAPFRLLADDDDILCDADYDSASEELNHGADTERMTWNRDTQDVVGNDDLAPDDVVWEQPVPKHSSPIPSCSPTPSGSIAGRA